MSNAQTARPRILVFGEVLFDCFPDGARVLGGAPFNVAWNLHGLGAAPLLVSRVGRDALGDEIRSAMQSWGLDVRALQTDSQHATGTVEVRLHDGEPTFDIVAGRAYDFMENPELPDAATDFEFAVHGTLALRGDRSRSCFDGLLNDAAIPRFYDVNLRAPWWDLETVRQYLRRARIVKLNEHELAALTPGASHVREGIGQILALGPELICLTRGAKGATVHDRGGCLGEVEPAAGETVVDTVGAGDAFASVFLLGHVLRWEVERTLSRAQAFAAAVVGLKGATVNDPSFYAKFREAWSQS